MDPMIWMNEYEITSMVERFDDPKLNNLRLATHVLRDLMRWTNTVSDGWPYWNKPAKAAAKLMTLIDVKYRGIYTGEAITDITDAELKAALTPIKSFLTRQDVEHTTKIRILHG
jgi:hypothetical protein